MPRALCALAMTGVLQGVRCAARHMGPALQGVFVGQGPCALPGVRCKAESPSHGCAVPTPFRQGGLGTGGTDCHSQCAHWLRNDRGFTRGAVGRGDEGIAPYGGETEIHLLSGGRGRTPPLRRVTRGVVKESPSHGFAMTVLFFMEAVLRTVFAGVAGGGATGRKLLA